MQTKKNPPAPQVKRVTAPKPPKPKLTAFKPSSQNISNEQQNFEDQENKAQIQKQKQDILHQNDSQTLKETNQQEDSNIQSKHIGNYNNFQATLNNNLQYSSLNKQPQFELKNEQMLHPTLDNPKPNETDEFSEIKSKIAPPANIKRVSGATSNLRSKKPQPPIFKRTQPPHKFEQKEFKQQMNIKNASQEPMIQQKNQQIKNQKQDEPNILLKTILPMKKFDQALQQFQHYNQQDNQLQLNQMNSIYNQNQSLKDTGYSVLEERLKRLEQVRARIDQSSQEEYDIREQDDEQSVQSKNQKQYSTHRNDSLQSNQKQINIVDQRNVQQDFIPISEQFKVGQTNYQQMEIKSQHPDIDHQIQIQVTSQPVQSIDQSIAHQSQTHDHPISIVYSNLATQQTDHQYLPDQISNSHSDHHRSIELVYTNGNSVQHVQHYRSENDYLQDNRQDINQKEFQDQKSLKSQQAKSQKSDTQLLKPKHDYPKSKDYQHNDKNDTSLEMVHDDQNQTNNICKQKLKQQNKQNYPLSFNHTSVDNIQVLLKNFKHRKHQYQQKVQNLNKIQKKHAVQQQKHQQIINSLFDQVSQKNKQIVKNVSGKVQLKKGYFDDQKLNKQQTDQL